MHQLSMAATYERYLRPYAKMLLALAALREDDADLARREFAELAAESPHSPK